MSMIADLLIGVGSGRAGARAPGYALACAMLALACAACETASPEATTSEEDLTSATALERRATWQSYVYVPVNSNDQTVAKEIQRQVKSAIGALRAPEVALQDRDSLSNLDPKGWKKTELTVVDQGKPTGQKVWRVQYPYSDVALVRAKSPAAANMDSYLLFGDYTQRRDEINATCSDDAKTAADSLWFHFAPNLAKCKTAIAKEIDAINLAQKGLDLSKLVALSEVQRRYLPVRMKLEPVKAPPVTYPDYDKLWGFGTDRTKVVAYAFFGVDADELNPSDISAVEHFRFLRTLRARLPKLTVTQTEPYALLLDYTVAGKKITATYDDLANWIVDNSGFPKAITAAADREDLRRQVVARFAEHTIVWTAPVTVSLAGQSRDMTLEIRTFWGYEDGNPEWRQKATWRYLEAFWHSDIFLYQGHSHFGHGPLEPISYKSENFPNRYQVMLINSCVSFNYYDVDFIKMHPGGSKNLDVVVNGLPAFWTNMGEASANYLISLVDGQNKSWLALLGAMIVKPSWQPSGYDPMRAVNGELDNTFNALKTPLQVLYK